MTGKTTITALEEDERHARHRLDVYKARIAKGQIPGAMVADQKLRELERAWEGAAARLREAREAAE